VFENELKCVKHSHVNTLMTQELYIQLHQCGRELTVHLHPEVKRFLNLNENE